MILHIFIIFILKMVYNNMFLQFICFHEKTNEFKLNLINTDINIIIMHKYELKTTIFNL